MSWKKAQNAGAKQKLQRETSVPARESSAKKTAHGQCAMTGCDKPATVQHGRVKMCRGCASSLS